MEDTKNTELNEAVETETGIESGYDNDFDYETVKSGPSKGFVALCVGAIGAAIGGGIYAYKRHKNKKAAELEQEMMNCDVDDYSEYDGDFEDDLDEQPVEVIDEKSEAEQPKKK